MSVLDDAFVACERTQGMIDEFWANDLVFVREPMAGAEFLNSPINNNGLEQRILPGQGKVRTVRTIYQQRLLESEVEAFSAPTCTADSQIPDLFTDYTIDPTVGLRISKRIDRTQLYYNCMGNGEKFAQYIAAMVDALDRKVATQQMTELAALYGKWASDVSVTNDALVVPTYVAGSTVNINPNTMYDIQLALNKTGFGGQTFIVGGEDLVKYYTIANNGCCTNSGTDVQSMFDSFGLAVAWDRRLATALSTAASSLAIQPGAAFVLNFYNGAWKDELKRVPVIIEGSNYGIVAVRSPRFGLTYDLKVVDECANGGEINMILEYVGSVESLPSDLYATGDTYEGRNGINRIKVTNS